MVARNHRTIKNDMIVCGPPDPNHWLLVEDPSLDRNMLERVKKSQSNHTGDAGSEMTKNAAEIVITLKLFHILLLGSFNSIFLIIFSPIDGNSRFAE